MLMALILEYVDVEVVIARVPSQLKPSGQLVTVVQLPTSGHLQVSASPFKSLGSLSEIFSYVAPAKLKTLLSAQGMVEKSSQLLSSAGGKQFQVQVFTMK